MSSPCLSGGGTRAYTFDIEIVKSPSSNSTITRTSQTSSPSSTLSESSNTNLAISTRKSRTPRKRPNQTYNEATVLLSTAYPNVFSTKHLTNPRKFTKLPPHSPSIFDTESSELLLPFRVIDSTGFLLHPEKPNSQILQSKLANLWERPCSSPANSSMEIDEEDFDAESILDEEMEAGIDSIMGNLSVDNYIDNNKNRESGDSVKESCFFYGQMNSRNWNPMGLGIGRKLECGFGMRKGNERAMREADDGNWWCFPTVDVVEISPKLNKPPPAAAPVKKKKKKVEKLAVIELKKAAALSPHKEKANPKLNPNSNSNSGGLILKLNYEAVVNAWSDRGSPFSDEISGSDAAENDVNARLAQIDLFSEGGGLREASVLRYKEKRRTRLFSKKIRYQVRKVNADGRPRMKGRFVRSPNSSTKGQR